MPLDAQPPQRVEQAADVRFRQRGGRLVEDEDVGLDRERAPDRDQRALGGGERRQRRRSGSMSLPIAAQRVRRRPADLAPGYQAETIARIARLHRDVLGDRHPIDEAEILVDEGLSAAGPRRDAPGDRRT